MYICWGWSKTTLKTKLIPLSSSLAKCSNQSGWYHGKTLRFTHAFISITNFVDNYKWIALYQGNYREENKDFKKTKTTGFNLNMPSTHDQARMI